MTTTDAHPRPADPTTDVAILCPLCDYDLRGLTEPRCPECGYTFEWPEVTDPSRRLHRYLFEHHPEQNARSFVRTLLGSHAPRRFWRSLLPAQPSRAGRLVLYWCLAAFPLLLVMIGHYGVWGWEYYRQVQRDRAMMLTTFSRNPNGLDWVVREHGSLSNMIDVNYPLPPNPRFYRHAWDAEGHWMLYLAGVVLAWPWLTFVTLLLFRISMRRARIKPVHVLRCVLYGFDSVLWLAPVTAVAVAARAVYASNVLLRRVTLPAPPISLQPPWSYRPDLASDALFWFGLALLPLMTYKLAVAFRLYLKFDHPAATVLCSQLIVALLVAVYTVNSLNGGLW